MATSPNASDPNAPYDPNTDDIVAGGSHHDPSQAEGAGYDPTKDDVVVGRNAATAQTIANLPPMINRSWKSLADIGTEQPTLSQTPIRDLARVTAAATDRGSAGLADTLLNPDQMILRPLMVGGTAAYDWLAPKVGLPQTSPALHKMLTDPEQGDVGSLVQNIGQRTGTDPYAVVPRTPLEARVATAAEALPAGAALGGGFGGVGAGIGAGLGAAGSLAGAELGNFVDPRWRPAVEMSTNMLLQLLGAKVAPTPGAKIDASTANIAQTGREQGIPFSAPDVTPNTIFRSPASVRATSDALQGNIIRDLGGNPDTGNAVTANRMTPDFLDQVRRDTGNGLDTIANNNDINTVQGMALQHQLRAIEADVNNVTGVTPADRNIMRQRIAEVRQRIDPATGRMSGTDYQGLTNTGSALDDLASDGNSGVANIGRRVMAATRDAFQGSLSPDDAALNSRLRYQWRLMNAVKPLVREAQGQSIDMGGLAQQILDQSQHFDLGRRDMAYTGGGQLGDYMSQARLIAGGPTPQGGASLGAPIFTAPGVMAMSGPHPVASATGLMLQGAIEKLLGPYARSDYRTNQAFDAAMNPVSKTQRNLGLLAGATIP